MEALGRIGFGLFGLAVLLGIAWLFSNNKRAVDWRLVATGVALQIAFAALVLLVPGGREVFDALGRGFVKILSFVAAGSNFIFGSLMDTSKFGFIFAFQVLPTIIFFSALMGVLYHLGVMQAVVRAMAWAITKVMRVSGAETTSVCASIFIGQTEAPLTIRPYISRMTPSELLTIMVGGMAHIAGGVLAAYVGMLGGSDPVQQAFYAKHLLTASVMAAPATLVISKILVPETGEPLTRGTVKIEVEKTTANVIDAAASGAGDGWRLALNIGAMLLAFIALIALLNWPLTWLGEVTGIAAAIGKPTDLATIFGYLLAPLAWVIGTPWQDAQAAFGGQPDYDGGFRGLAPLFDGLDRAAKRPKLHLVGHSAGAIVLGRFLSALGRFKLRELDLGSIHLMAPACTVLSNPASCSSVDPTTMRPSRRGTR